MHKSVLAALLLIAFAGCAENDEPTDPDPAAPEPTLADVGAALDGGQPLINLERIGHIALGGEEADAWGDYIFVDQGSTIRILQMTLDNGTALFSEVSSFTATAPKDVKVSDDGNWLFLGNDDPASGTPLDAVRAGGFYVYDVSDKENPVFASRLPVGQLRGPHMVFYIQQPDGTELVLGANADVSINEFDPATGRLTERSRYAPDPITEVNRDPQVIDAYYQLFTHDMFAMVDPVTDQTLMYTASWDAGLHIVDISDPSNPAQLGFWNDYPEGHTGNLHTVATEWIGDKRITVGSVEVGFEIVGGIPYFTGNEKSILYVWDTTDLSDPTLLGTWENPFGIGPGQSGLALGAVTGDEIKSTHNLQLEDGRVYMAHYGLGVWVLDVSTPEAQATPEVLAFDLEAGNLWDTIVHRGVTITSGSDGITGYRFALDALGPAGISSRA